MTKDTKVAVIGSTRAAALAQAVSKFGISVEEAGKSIADAKLQIQKLLTSENFDYGLSGKARLGGRDRPSKLIRRIKTTC